MASIRAHRDSNTLIITKNSNYTKPITHRINLIMGINSRCMERIYIDGNLELGKSAQVTGNVKANDVILGPGSMIYGDLTVEGDLLALDGARVIGNVRCNGAAFIRPGVGFGSLDVGGMIELQGKPPAKHIRGKIVVNEEEKPGEDHMKRKNESEIFKKAKPEEKHVIQPPKVPVKSQPPAGQKKPPAKSAGRKPEEKPKRKGFFGLFK